ncbi:MAG: UvrD-helicase domain-containing protein [Armatimonadota bacterium]|nr:UvrD-helicase domain-containing protein [Armatimonadota bacterium]
MANQVELDNGKDKALQVEHLLKLIANNLPVEESDIALSRSLRSYGVIASEVINGLLGLEQDRMERLEKKYKETLQNRDRNYYKFLADVYSTGRPAKSPGAVIDDLEEQIRRSLHRVSELKVFATIAPDLDSRLIAALEETNRKRKAEAEKLRQESLRREAEQQERIRQENLLREAEEKARIERAKQEVLRQELLKEVKKRIRDDFLSADSFFETSCAQLISDEEYQNEKASFAKAWITTNTPPDQNGNKKIPDNEQAAAISAVHGHIQVVARAGSGKTETLANRTFFLKQHCGVAPAQMLLLAFNGKAAKDLVEKVSKRLNDDMPHVMTFHALARAIVKPKQDLLKNDDQEDNQGLNRAFQEVIDDRFKDDAFMMRVRRLMLAHFKADWDRIIAGGCDLKPDELLRFRRNLARETLNGEYVKSFGEKAIANFLFEHDIPYLYEEKHWRKGLSYQPDFTIPLDGDGKRGVVIEYFGLIGDPDYDEQMQQKRDDWAANSEWTLLEFIPGDLANGIASFEQKLRKVLEDKGIPCKRLSEEVIWRLAKKRAIDRFTKSMTGFVGRCRKHWILPDKLSQMIVMHQKSSEVEGWFLELACELYVAYLERLEATNQEDFDGLMQRAVALVEGGKTKFARWEESGDLRALRYIFIDEYQDFSELFHRLMGAIRRNNPSAEFFCVGDDWQAINGFAGSDLKFYDNFSTYFSPSKRLDVSTNYRSVKTVVDVGNALMHGHGRGKPAVAAKQIHGQVLMANLSKFTRTLLEEQRFKGALLTPMILRLAGKALGEVNSEGKPNRVQLLSRRKNLFLPRGGSWSIDKYLVSIRNQLPQDWRDRISISTTHGFKGGETDVVIVLDAYERSYPLIHPNWVFARILGETLEKIVDEERRLFYVALTRAKEKLVIVTEQGRISPFLDDILRHAHVPEIDWDKYPPLSDKTRWLVVKVSGSIEVNGQLKAEGYQFRDRRQENTKSWDKSFLREGFSIQTLQDSLWARQAMREPLSKLKVRAHDDHDVPVAHYSVDAGRWVCIFDKLAEATGEDV